MASYILKKKSKLNTYKAVRENIQLNKNNSTKDNLTHNLTHDDHLLFQMAEISLAARLHTQKLNKNEKLVLRWWEN